MADRIGIPRASALASANRHDTTLFRTHPANRGRPWADSGHRNPPPRPRIRQQPHPGPMTQLRNQWTTPPQHRPTLPPPPRPTTTRYYPPRRRPTHRLENPLEFRLSPYPLGLLESRCSHITWGAVLCESNRTTGGEDGLLPHPVRLAAAPCRSRSAAAPANSCRWSAATRGSGYLADHADGEELLSRLARLPRWRSRCR